MKTSIFLRLFKRLLIILFLLSLDCLAEEVELTPSDDVEIEQNEKNPIKTKQQPIKEEVNEGDDSGLHAAKIVILQGLNKITARTSNLTLNIDERIYFGNLEIIAKQCWKSSPEEKPDNSVLLEISEQKPGEKKEKIFYGWMFSSSPALSALEHPVYDITVINCEKTKKF